MSSGYWQIKRQTEQLNAGRSTTQRVKEYCRIWESRCYFDGIPDQAIPSLEKINKVPSYKSIAVAILKNDLLLRSLGFYENETELSLFLIENSKNKPQLNLF